MHCQTPKKRGNKHQPRERSDFTSVRKPQCLSPRLENSLSYDFRMPSPARSRRISHTFPCVCSCSLGLSYFVGGGHAIMSDGCTSAKFCSRSLKINPAIKSDASAASLMTKMQGSPRWPHLACRVVVCGLPCLLVRRLH